MTFPNDVTSTVVGAFGTEVTYEASSDILAGQAVIISSGKIVPATAGAAAIGIALYDIPTGEPGAVRVVGVARTVAGAAVTAGAIVKTDADGAVVAASTAGDRCLGVALEAAANAGDPIMVAIGPQTYYTGA